MKSLVAIASLCASLTSAEYFKDYNETYIYLQNKYPINASPQVLPRQEVAALNKATGLFKRLRSSPVPSLSSVHRVPTDCTYPLEIVILQDVTGSFTDDMPVMANSELPIMFNTLSETHPGSSFGIVSFADKPILPFGYPHEDNYRDDYCYLLDAPLGQNLDDLTAVYNNYLASGGADPPENQYGAIFNAIQARKIGWGGTADAIKLIVVVTDAPPHYDDDNGGLDRHNMSKFSGVFDEDNINDQCTSQFYPSWQETIAQVNKPSDGSLPPYVAFLVYDDGADKKTLKTWEWFASQIFENTSFVRERNEDSSNFWEQLSQIVGVMDSVECQGTSTSTSTVITTASTTDNGSGVPEGSTQAPPVTSGTTDPTDQPSPTASSTTVPTGTTTTGTTVPETTTTDSPCPPCPCPGPGPCEPCKNKCGNEAYIRYPKDAKEIDIHILNQI